MDQAVSDRFCSHKFAFFPAPPERFRPFVKLPRQISAPTAARLFLKLLPVLTSPEVHVEVRRRALSWRSLIVNSEKSFQRESTRRGIDCHRRRVLAESFDHEDSEEIQAGFDHESDQQSSSRERRARACSSGFSGLLIRSGPSQALGSRARRAPKAIMKY